MIVGLAPKNISTENRFDPRSHMLTDGDGTSRDNGILCKTAEFNLTTRVLPSRQYGMPPGLNCNILKSFSSLYVGIVFWGGQIAI
jgi:hypothetical protein